MRAHFELLLPARAGRSFVAFERRDRRFDFHWHFHPEYELTLITRSAGQRLAGDNVETYGAGDLVLLGPNLPHAWTSEGSSGGQDHRALVVHFAESALPPALLGVPEFKAIRDLLARSQRGLHFRRQVATAVAPKIKLLTRQRGLAAWLTLLGIFQRLAGSSGRALASANFGGVVPGRQHAQLQRALAFIDGHTDQPIGLRDVAKAAGVSPATVVRLFRRIVGRSFVDHLNELRVGIVCSELIDTDKGIAEIAYARGFNNLANFNRCFREVKGMTPSEFRSRFSQ